MSKYSKLLCLLMAASAIVFAASLYLNRNTIRGMFRQNQDIFVAEEYLKNYRTTVSEKEAEITELVSENEYSLESSSSEMGSTEIVDEQYYSRGGIIYTPDFARGTLDCVLEIPSISLKRGVYTGTREEIEYDLSIWLTTAASSSLELGKTHYAIYGHNHPVQDLSFNRLKDIQKGEYFTLTKEDQVYCYRVTDIFADWRNSGRRKYATNLDQDPSLCFIFTCGRDHWLLNGQSTRYKDYIIQGTIQGVYSVTEWRNKGNIPSDPNGETVSFVSKNQFGTELEVRTETAEDSGVRVLVLLKDEKGNPVWHAGLSLLDSSGNEVCSWVQETEPKELSLTEGTWVIAATELSDRYEEPPGKEVRITEERTTVLTIGEQTEEEDVSWSEILFITSIVAAVLTAAFSILFIISTVKPKHRKEPDRQ